MFRCANSIENDILVYCMCIDCTYIVQNHMVFKQFLLFIINTEHIVKKQTKLNL